MATTRRTSSELSSELVGISTICFALAIPATALAGPLQDDPELRNKQWIAIAASGFEYEVEGLLGHRRAQGLSVCVWTVADLNASYGGWGPLETRQALQDAWNTWAVKPRYVLIVSDTDVRDAMYGIGDWQRHLPELGHWEDSIRGLWPYMDLDDDGDAEIVVGRLPASQFGDLTNYAAKVIEHDLELAAASRPTAYRMIVQDVSDAGNDGEWVRDLADSLYELWVPAPRRARLHYSQVPCCQSAVRDAANRFWNEAPEVLIAMGTGSNWLELVGFWTRCAVPGGWSIQQLEPGRYPALLGLSCAINATDRPVASACDPDPYGVLPNSVTEALLCAAPDRGASVVIAPTRNTHQQSNFVIGKHLLEQAPHATRWGDAYARALENALAEDPAIEDHVFQYVLQGDPAAAIHPGNPGTIDAESARAGSVSRPYPNPARRRTTIDFLLPTREPVRIRVVDLAGRTVRRLVDRVDGPGAFTVGWDLRDADGRDVPPGLYWVEVARGGGRTSRRITVVR